MVYSLDPVDTQIVTMLQANGRMSQADIARALDLAPSAVLERMRKLESRGVITGYIALVDPVAVDCGMLAFIAVRSTEPPGDERVGEALASIPEVLEVHHVAGDDCFLLKVRARDAQHISSLLRRRLGAIPELTSTRTTIVLDTLKETARLPMPAVEASEVAS
jgi:Lrp/AsnC family leucine-responsive transcriptional regulator